ncbi:GNAT family N-acetyltransferase [Bradyrhizobium sp. CCBAU 11386]|uniref:GNAT family N-acetyltransferase n=1 Tax=Bradyrhizobium sp. CCBAU 11386 TaxID=1630837 RepID=UPI002304C233|nr:GNAT family N-acetyltransferase [Bradyrhizobium sp. CCBAU 11386]
MIEQVTLSDVVKVRHELLRPNQVAAATVTKVDHHPRTVHFGAVVANKIVGVVSTGPEAFPADDAIIAWRLRGFAVYPQYRRQGIGTALLQALKLHLSGTECELLWAYARCTALTTYTRSGFECFGPEFDIPPTGLHNIICMRNSARKEAETGGPHQ